MSKIEVLNDFLRVSEHRTLDGRPKVCFVLAKVTIRGMKGDLMKIESLHDKLSYFGVAPSRDQIVLSLTIVFIVFLKGS